MLGVRARTLLLAFAGGSVDAVGFVLLFGIFTAHLSGDVTHLAVDVGIGHFGPDAVARILVLVAFVAGLVLGVAFVALSRGPGSTVLLAEIGLVAVAMVGGALAPSAQNTRGSLAFYALVGVLGLAMGLQSAVLRRAAGTGVHTTFVTGMVTAVTEDAVAVWRDRSDQVARRRVGLHGGICVAYFAGGIGGAALTVPWAFWALLLPLAALTAVLATGGTAGETVTP